MSSRDDNIATQEKAAERLNAGDVDAGVDIIKTILQMMEAYAPAHDGPNFPSSLSGGWAPAWFGARQLQTCHAVGDYCMTAAGDPLDS